MKTTKRFEEAITKLYKAFHEETLDSMNCKHCAVGNICNNSKNWGIYSNTAITTPEELKTGYSRVELNNIESYFLYGSIDIDNRLFLNNISNLDVEYGESTIEKQKELQFKGLCAVVKYLAELDNIPDPTDYSKLFETENNKAKYELIF